MKNKTLLKLIMSGLILMSILACQKTRDEEPITQHTRSYLMGFQSSAPRWELDLALQSLHMWELRSDAAIISSEVPWDSLFSGVTPQDYVKNNCVALVDYYRSKNFKLWVYIDPGNGLNRRTDATALINRNKSISQPEIQAMYRRFAFVMDSMLKPEHIGLAMETNAIRELSTPLVYQSIVKAANDAANDIRAVNKQVKLSISVQVDFAWGKLDNTTYKSIDQDYLDFPFIDELGLSSYPYFVFEKPQDIPTDYYTRLIAQKPLPVFVSEGGWATESVLNTTGTLQKQSDYMFKHAELLDEVNATALFQLTFTDFDLSSWPIAIPTDLELFTSIGLVDINMNPKSALANWDEIFKRTYTPK